MYMFTLYQMTVRIVLCLMLFSTVLQLYCGSRCTYSCFPGVVLTSAPHNIVSKPLVAFPCNHCRERKESCCNDYHQSSERIPTRKNIGLAGDRTSDLLFSSPQCYRLSYRAQHQMTKFLTDPIWKAFTDKK